MFFLIYGEDSYRSRKTLAAVRGRFSATRDASGMNCMSFRATEQTVEAAMEALLTAPFLAERKMVVLEGYLTEETEAQQRLVELLGRLPESTVAVFFEAASAEQLKDGPLFSLLKKQEFSAEHGPLNASQAAAFVAAEAQQSGVAAPAGVARALVSRVGPDSWRLAAETAKISAYVLASGRQEMLESDVQALVAGAAQEPVFAFVDSCLDGRPAEALAQLAALLDSGMSEFQILAALAKQFRTVLCAQDLVRRGIKDAQVLAGMLGIHPFPAGKAMASGWKYRPATLRARFQELVEIERRAKTGAASPAAMLSVFASRVAA